MVMVKRQKVHTFQFIFFLALHEQQMKADRRENTYNIGSFSRCTGVRGGRIRLLEYGVVIGHHLPKKIHYVSQLLLCIMVTVNPI